MSLHSEATTSSPSKTHNVVRAMAEIAIFSALGYVLDLFAGLYSASIFPNGGSIGIAMVCVFLIAYRWGLWQGVLTGLIMGLLDIADGFYVISGANWWNAFAQVALDYWIAYPLAGFAGVFAHSVKRAAGTKRKMLLFASLGCLLGGALKYLSHVASGAIFWGADSSSFAWQFKESAINPWAYSAIYNIAYMGPDIVLSTLIVDVLLYVWPKAVIRPGEIIEVKEVHSHPVSWRTLETFIAGIILLVTNLTVYLILAIGSYYDDGFGKSILYGPKTLLVLSLIGALLTGYGIYEMVRELKARKDNAFSWLGFAFLGAIWGIYALMETIKIGMEETFAPLPFTFELLSSLVGFVSLAFMITAWIFRLQKKASASKFAFLGETCFWLSLAIHGFGFGIFATLQGSETSILVADYVTGSTALLIWVVSQIDVAIKQRKK